RRRRDHLEVADARPAARAPVDEGLGAVREVAVVQSPERNADGLRRAVVHREPQPAPIDGRAEPPLLAQDDLAGFGDELAHPLQVALATEAPPALALLREDAVEDELG